jgi:thiamine transport system substrate-binding protein
MFVYPVNQTAQLPEVFTQYAQVTDQPASISYAEIAANRDAWIEAWTEVMK